MMFSRCLQTSKLLFFAALIFLVGSIAAYPCFAITVVIDPYAEVDWSTIEQHKANLHTHTTQSDGDMPPHVVIDEYQKRGFSILALTDHNLCTWPWTGLSTLERKGKALMGDKAEAREPEKPASERKSPPVPAYEDRDPQALNMLAVAGNEPSIHHDMGAYFVQYETRSRKLEQTLREVGEAGGMAMIFHPGRYWEPEADGSIGAETVALYAALYREFPHVFGIEVVNQGWRYKRDFELWDQLLLELLPERTIWGYANNDMHAIKHMGRDWNVFLLKALDESHLREAMKKGCSYFSTIGTHDEAVRDVEKTPRIESISHDKERGVIAIMAVSGGAPLAEEQCKWISAGKTVHTGLSLPYNEVQGVARYVRAELAGEGGTTFTNPWVFAE